MRGFPPMRRGEFDQEAPLVELEAGEFRQVLVTDARVSRNGKRGNDL
jgi:hypothetical protein